VSRSLNKAILIGNVGSDPEVRSTTNGSRVASFSLATGKQWNDQSGAKQEKTEWHKCVVWNNSRSGSGLADVVEKYVKKGSKLYIEGEIQYRQYQDKEGQTKYITEISVKELMMLDGRGGGGGDDEGFRRSAPPARAGKAAAGGAAGNSANDDFTDFPGALEDDDDDLPF
jgi:single-strand DNA-binding protein